MFIEKKSLLVSLSVLFRSPSHSLLSSLVRLQFFVFAYLVQSLFLAGAYPALLVRPRVLLLDDDDEALGARALARLYEAWRREGGLVPVGTKAVPPPVGGVRPLHWRLGAKKGGLMRTCARDKIRPKM